MIHGVKTIEDDGKEISITAVIIGVGIAFAIIMFSFCLVCFVRYWRSDAEIAEVKYGLPVNTISENSQELHVI